MLLLPNASLGKQHRSACSWYLRIEEGGSTVADHDLCALSVRETEIYKSNGGKIEFYVRSSSNFDTLPPFLLNYKGNIILP